MALVRLDDAKVLLANERFSAAFYLAGYVVECALKACIAGHTRQYEFPDKKRAEKSHTHKVRDLAVVAQLPTDVDFEKDRTLREYWQMISTRWSETCRYENRWRTEAEALLEAVDDPNHGVLQWLQKYW
ncbi:MAG: HEPN domain-containing protein [Phycisphaerales bacterium]|nr:HEPN domain-containing protein [Phycisphaerales bacterium]